MIRSRTELETVRAIRDAVRAGRLPRVFTAAQVDQELSIDWAATFLPKHRHGNASRKTVHFVRVTGGRAPTYRLATL